MAQFVLAFDVYGTLFQTSSICGPLSEYLHLDNDKASEVNALWRRYQLEYTWRLNSMNIYEPFDVVTQKSLQHALKELGIGFDEGAINKLMDAYNVLPLFPDALSTLQKLAKNNNVKVVIFSNGTLPMVRAELNAAGLSDLTPDIYVADNVKRYNPSPEIYKGLLQSIGKEAHPKECFLVSGNPFNVTGALAQGMQAIWVNRGRKGWADAILPIRNSSEQNPFEIVHNLEEIPEYITSRE